MAKNINKPHRKPNRITYPDGAVVQMAGPAPIEPSIPLSDMAKAIEKFFGGGGRTSQGKRNTRTTSTTLNKRATQPKTRKVKRKQVKGSEGWAR